MGGTAVFNTSYMGFISQPFRFLLGHDATAVIASQPVYNFNLFINTNGRKLTDEANR